jgi:uncharacterized protein (TIGR03437 family)
MASQSGNFSYTAASSVTQSFSVTAPFSITCGTGPAQLEVAYATSCPASYGTLPYTWSITSGALPAGLMLNTSTGAITGTPVVAGAYTYTVQVQDSSMPVLTASQTVSGTIPFLPSISSILNQADGSSPPLAPASLVSLSGSHLAFSSATASGTPLPTMLAGVTVTVNGTQAPLQSVSPTAINFQLPSATPIGTSVPVVVTNNGSSSNTFGFQTALHAPGIFPNATLNQNGSANSSIQPATAGSTITVFWTGIGATSPSVTDGTAAASSPLSTPATLTAAAVDGVPTTVVSSYLQPGQVGVAETNLQVPASLGTGTYSLTLTQNGYTSVAAQVYVTAPTVTFATLPGGTVGVSYSATLNATGGVPPYSNWAVNSGALPPGTLQLNPSTGQISGTPSSVTGSPFNFGVTVTDSAGNISASQSFSIGIAQGSQTISFGTLPNVGLSTGSFNVTATASSGLTVSFTSTTTPVCTVSGNIVTLVSVGTCSIMASQGGNSSYAAASSVPQSFSVTAPFSITCGAGPAQLEVAYATSCPASYGTLPYTWSITSGSLPAGLMLNSSTGAITGTPLVAGAYTYTVQVQDSSMTVMTASQTVSGTILFGKPMSYTAGQNPFGIVTGDFNNDHIPDIVEVNSGDDSFSFLQGVGDGTFLAPKNFSMTAVTAALPSGIVAADFNGDGNLDVAIVHPTASGNSLGNTVTIYLGDGTGNFTAATATLTTGTMNTGIATADFNGDGKPDLAIASCGDQTIHVYTGNGNGTFTQASQLGIASSCGSGSLSLTAADATGDGHADIVLSNSNTTHIAVFPGNGNGTFQTASTYSVTGNPGRVVVSDFNNDGTPDLAVLNLGSPVNILLGNASGGFGIPSTVSVAAGAGDIATSDFNQDGNPDLAVSATTPSGRAGTVSVLLGDGTGHFTRLDVAAGNTPQQIAATDFNGDGQPDLAVTDKNDGAVTVLLNVDSSNSPWSQVTTTGGPPSARSSHTAIFDFATAQMLIFGGTGSTGNLSDLWSLQKSQSNALQWTQLTPSGLLPTARHGHSAVYDSTNSRMMVFGGATGGASTCANDVWVLSNANGGNGTPAWSQLSPTGTAPAPRSLHSAVYDPTTNSMIVFGGSNCLTNGSQLYNDVWILSNANGMGGTPAWTQLSLTGSAPASRDAPTAVYDSAGNHMIVFGGLGVVPSYFNDVWILSNANNTGGTPSWAQLSTTGAQISQRAGHSAIYDATTNRMTVFGGAGNSGQNSDTWVLSNANGVGGTPGWTQIDTSGSAPAARVLHTAVYGPNAMIVFGGQSSGPTYLNDTWTLDNPSAHGEIPSSGPVITTSTLPPGFVSIPYGPVTLSATGGFGPYTWTAIGAPAGITVSPSGVVRGTPTTPGTSNSFIVTVTDTTTSLTAMQTYSVTVTPALVISTATLPGGTFGSFYGPVQVAATGGSGTYTWYVSGLPSGLSASAAGLISGTPRAGGQFSVYVAVMDNASHATSNLLSLTIAYPPLLITTTSLPNGSLNKPSSSITMAATGGSGHYSWSATGLPSGMTMSTGGLLSGTPTTGGTFLVTTTVTDALANTSQTTTFNLGVLSITTTSLSNSAVNQAYVSATMAATGGSGSYSWSASGLPGGMTMSASGVLSGTPTAAGTFTVTATVTDTSDSLSASFVFPSITVFPALSITTTLLPNGTVNQAYGPVTMAATGGSGKYSWSVSGAPAAVSMTTAGVLSGTPTAAGSFSIAAKVTDTITNQVAQQTYSVGIAYAALLLSGPGNLGGFAPGASISGSYSAAGGAAPYTWSAPNLPAGLTLSPSTGALTGTITQPGNYTFRVQVTDSEPVSIGTSTNVSLFVLGISTTSLPSGTTTVFYSQTLSAAGGSPPYIWSGAAVDGISVSSAGVLSGTPPNTGTFSVSVSVTSGGVTVPATLSLTVTTQLLPLKIPGGGDATAPLGLTSGSFTTPYSQALQAINGEPPYSWSVIGGSLPDGLTLSSSGTIAGTPTKVGSFAFTGQVTDTSGAAVSSAFTLAIAAPPLTISAGASLPNGIVGSPYPSQLITAAGGTGPYTFQATGTLPAGLSLDTSGQITGTPTAAGSSSFTVTVTDSTTPTPLTASSSFQISIEPAHADLILSQTALSFSINTGAQSSNTSSISVSSSISPSGLNFPPTLDYTISVTPAAPWLDLSGGGAASGTTGATPGIISVALDPNNAPSLSAGSYQTSVVVTCATPSGASQPSPCAGNSQTIAVTLNVAAAPPQLAVTPSLLSFSSQTANPQSISESLNLQNAGGGTITVNSVTAADSFVTIGSLPTTIPPGSASNPASVAVTVTVNPTGLSAGFYQSTIFVNTSAGSANIPVTLLVAQNATMTLSPAGSQFRMSFGSSPGNPGGSFLVEVSGSSAVNWTATASSDGGWLTLNTASGTATSASPGSVSFQVDNTIAPTLSAQAHYGTIQITSNDVVDSPQNFLIILNVAPAASPVTPDPEPSGLVFISSGTGALPPQTVQVFVSSQTPLNYSASSDSSWLVVNVGTGSTSSASPDSSSVSVNMSGLAAGVYRGGVSYQFTSVGSSGAVRTVNVALIVEASGSSSSNPMVARPRATCAPTQLVPTQTGLGNNFAQPTSWPTPLAVLLVDNCGQPVTNGQVVATFSNGDPPLALNATNTTSGIYSGTWTPRTSSGQVTVAARATASGFPAATAQITGSVTPNAVPLLTQNGTLNVFAPVVGGPLAPGTIVQIYGANLAGQASPATTVPLPANLNQTSVVIGGLEAPLYYVSPGQINAMVPFELTAGRPYQVIVSANGALSTPNSIQLTSDAPGIAQFAAGQIIAQHLDGSLVLESAPAAPGEIIVFYAAGMGLTNQTVPSGTASPSTNLAVPLDTPSITLNGAPVTNILFAGLTPSLVGLYQVDFQVPANAPNGDLQLIMTQATGQSNTTILPVHQ